MNHPQYLQNMLIDDDEQPEISLEKLVQFQQCLSFQLYYGQDRKGSVFVYLLFCLSYT